MEKTVLCVTQKMLRDGYIDEHTKWFVCDSEEMLNETVSNFKGWKCEGETSGYDFKSFTKDEVLDLTVWDLCNMTVFQFAEITNIFDFKIFKHQK